MKWQILLICVVLGVSNASECGICLHGRCLVPTPIYTGAEGAMLAPSAGIDKNNNILYIRKTQAIEAIQLDNNTITTIPTARPELTPAYLRVDDITGDVYYSYGSNSKQLYRYQHQRNLTDAIQQRTSNSMWAHNGTVYWAGLGKGLNIKTESSPQQTIASFKDVRVKNLAFDKLGNMYVGTKSTVYKKKPNDAKTVLATRAYAIKVDRNGEVYLFDTSKHFTIQQVDLNTNELKIVGVIGQKYHNYIRLMFDKYNNVIAKQLVTLNSWVHFKDNSDKCTYVNTDSIPDIINVSQPKIPTTTTTQSPIF